MVDYGATAARSIELLAALLTAGDPAGIDPQGNIRGLADLVAQRFQGSPEASALYTRFQQEPGNPDLRTAVRGRLTEAMLLDASFSGQLQSALWRVESISGPTNTMGQQTFTNTGQIRGSAFNQGSGTIDQSRRFKISLPIAGLALLASGVLAGGGVVIYNAVNGDAGTHMYSIDNERFTLMYWTTDNSGQVHGGLEDWGYGYGVGHMSYQLAIVGSQHGNDLSMTLTGQDGGGANVNETIQGVLKGDTFTFTIKGGVATLHKTTRDQFNKAMADWEKSHP